MNLCNTSCLKNYFCSTLFVLLTIPALSQVSISHQLIGSTGNYSAAGGLTISSTVGELAVATFFSNSHYLTQGFQQPTNEDLSFTVNSLNASCSSAANGYAEVLIKSGVGPFQFLWTPGNETTSSIKNLNSGTYTVKVTDARGFSIADTIQILLDFDGDCGFHIYSGISPNGDNHNDTWIIDGIESYPNNRVSIFNRWGDMVWDKGNYNNTSVLWTGLNSQEEQLPEGTFFYIVTIDNKKYKGWVELTR